MTEHKTFHRDKGELLIYVDDKYKSEIKTNLNTYENWEALLIQVTGNGLSKKITIGYIYIDHQGPATKILHYEFSTELSSLENQ